MSEKGKNDIHGQRKSIQESSNFMHFVDRLETDYRQEYRWNLTSTLCYPKKKVLPPGLNNINKKLPGSRESFSNFDDKFIYNFWNNIKVEFQKIMLSLFKKIMLSLFPEFLI